MHLRPSFSRPVQRLLAGVMAALLASHLCAEPPAVDPLAPPRSAMPDPKLVNQEGDKVHLYSDLMKGRVVALSFIFTSCPTVCATIGINLGQLQSELRPFQGKEISLISITIDLENDTPAKLKEWGRQFHAAPGWSFLTGGKTEINELLKKLEVLTPDIRAHTPFMLIVNDRTGQWTRVNVLETPPQMIAEKLRQLVAR